jgi:heat shock protein HslJ
MRTLAMKMTFIFIIILFLTSCERKDNNTDTGQLPLLNTEWILTSIQNTKTNVVTIFPSNVRNESIIFTDSLNSLRVKGVCNGCAGTYLVIGASVSTSGLMCTMMYCSKWENYLFYNLDSMFHYKINNNLLTIYSRGSYNLNFISK